MASEYRMICDFCKKETKGWYEDEAKRANLGLNNWDVRIYSMWLESSEDKRLSELHRKTEINLDACHDCAKKAAAAIRGLIRKA